jgi:hypothetical protein
MVFYICGVFPGFLVFNASAMTAENTSNLIMAKCGRNMWFDVKNEHLKNSGIVCVKVTITTNIKIIKQHTRMLHYRINSLLKENNKKQ